MSDEKIVYVTRNNEQETLHYNANLMEKDKKYQVTWNDEAYILIKRDKTVDMYKFYADLKQK